MVAEEFEDEKDDGEEEEEEEEEESEEDEKSESESGSEESQLANRGVRPKIGASLQGFEKNVSFRSGLTFGEIIGLLIFTAVASVASLRLGFGFTGLLLAVVIDALFFIKKSLVFVRPMERGLLEYLGKYQRFVDSGMVILLPFVHRLLVVNISESRVDVLQQKLISKESATFFADLQIYYKVNDDEKSVKNSQYKAQNFKLMVTSLADTSLRAIAGKYTLKELNTKRNAINDELDKEIKKKTTDWGIEVVRTEIWNITLPEDMQKAFDEVVKQDNLRVAATHKAEAIRNLAEGEKQRVIKLAEGVKQREILEAEGFKTAEIEKATGKARAIEMVSKSQQKFFGKKAQIYKSLETAQIALKDNSKVVIVGGGKNQSLVNLLGDTAGVKPMPLKQG